MSDEWARYGLTHERGREGLRLRETVAQAVHLHLVTGLPLEQLIPREYRPHLPQVRTAMSAHLRASQRLATDRQGDPYLAPYLLPPESRPPFIPPARGAWFHSRAAVRPHRASGDLLWRPSWIAPRVVALCGQAIATDRRALPPGEQRCRRCEGARTAT